MKRIDFAKLYFALALLWIATIHRSDEGVLLILAQVLIPVSLLAFWWQHPGERRSGIHHLSPLAILFILLSLLAHLFLAPPLANSLFWMLLAFSHLFLALHFGVSLRDPGNSAHAGIGSFKVLIVLAGLLGLVVLFLGLSANDSGPFMASLLAAFFLSLMAGISWWRNKKALAALAGAALWMVYYIVHWLKISWISATWLEMFQVAIFVTALYLLNMTTLDIQRRRHFP